MINAGIMLVMVL